METIKTYLEKYWGLVALGIWITAAIFIDLIRLSPFALDEQAAKGLLLTWTVADNIINPIVIFGVPDFRALLYIPIGTYWPGNLLAAKLLLLVLGFLAVTMLYHWAKKFPHGDTAIIASALLLISPSMITQIDSMAAGPYILLGFVLGVWLDNAYRKNPNYFGGWYFSQMLWIAILTTIHPIALAYPIALAWRWFKNPHELKTSRHMYIGILISAVLSLLLIGGWQNLNFFGNPVEQLAISLQGSIIWSAEDIQWAAGIIASLFLILLMAIDTKFLKTDFLGSILALCIILGLVMPDGSWALVAITLLLYRGTHYLISFNQSRQKTGLLGQRGFVLIAVLIISTHFMMQDKNHVLTIRHAILDPVDELIQSMIAEASNPDVPFRAASQWPARTMLATKRDVFPLPPAMDDQEKMSEALKSLTHLTFDPRDPKNKPLADSLANLTGETETLGLFKAGVIVKVRNSNVGLSTQQRLAQDEKANRESEKPLETATPDERSMQ